ncbi:MAG: hypothetical protein WAT39_12630 [Planctomycetota bacterium]
MIARTVAAPFLLAALTASAIAQIPLAIPYARTLDLLVVDGTYDGVWRLTDSNLDGDYNDAGEVNPFYTDTIGAFSWSTPTAITSAPDGTVYVSEVSADAIYALRDGNGDGDANDPGEHRIFFDGTNLSGFPIPQAYGLTADAIGRVFVAANNASSPAGPDRILLLQDLTNDGDAQDLGEAIDYYNAPGTTGALAASIPTHVIVGGDTFVYFTEAGTTYTKGVWRLVDLNFNGHCNDPGEATLFWTPPFATSPQYWSLGLDSTWAFLVTDHASGNEKVWRGVDANSNGIIEPGEQTLFYQTAGSSWWDLTTRADGTVLLVDSDAPDKITALRDGNNDGDALDANESYQAYQAGLAATTIAVRGATMQRGPSLVLVPAAVPVGTLTNVTTVASKPFDLCATVISLGLGAPFPLAPWGVVEIDVTAFVSIGGGLADANGYLSIPLTVPSNPALIGYTYAFQGVSGDFFRLSLTNAAVMTVTP